MTNKYEQKPIIATYEHKVAQSGEVFYLKDGVLCSCATTDDYNKVVAEYVLRQEAENFYNTYFTYKVSGTTIHSPIRNQSYITNAISGLPIDKQLEVFTEYYNLVMSAKPEIANLKGDYMR